MMNFELSQALLLLTSLLPTHSVALTQDAGTRVLQIYDLSDVAEQRNQETTPTPRDDEQTPLRRATEDIAAVVRRFVEPPLVRDAEEIQIVAPAGLVVLARPDQHRWIAAFLETLRAGVEPISIECVFLSIPEARFQTLPITAEQHVVEPGPDAAGLDLLLEELAGFVALAPKITAFSGQKVRVEATERIPFIKGFKLHERVYPGEKVVLDPDIDFVASGYRFEGLVARLPGGVIGLDFALSWSSAKRPFPSRETEHGAIAVPVATTVETQARVLLAPGASLVLPAPEHEGVRRLQVVKVR